MFPCPSPTQCTGAAEHRSAANCEYLKRQGSKGRIAQTQLPTNSMPVSNTSFGEGYNQVTIPGTWKRDASGGITKKTNGLDMPDRFGQISVSEHPTRPDMFVITAAPDGVKSPEKAGRSGNPEFAAMDGEYGGSFGVVTGEHTVRYDVPRSEVGQAVQQLQESVKNHNHRQGLGLPTDYGDEGEIMHGARWKHNESGDLRYSLDGDAEWDPDDGPGLPYIDDERYVNHVGIREAGEDNYTVYCDVNSSNGFEDRVLKENVKPEHVAEYVGDLVHDLYARNQELRK